MSRMTIDVKRKISGFVFVSPWLIGCLIFFVYPVIYSVIISVTQFAISDVSGFSFYNYQKAFVEDINFLPMFWSTIQDMIINTPLINVFALFVAILLNKKIACRGLFRSLFFLPVMLGTGFIMQQLLGQDIQQESISMARGLLLPDEVLLYLGPNLSEMALGFMSRITVIMWRSGVQILIYLTGLQSIPTSIYEAASIDSADGWQSFWLITLPMMTPTILLNVIYTIIDFFNDSSNGVIDYILNYGFYRNDFGYASSIGWIYFGSSFVFIILIYVVLNYFVKKTNDNA